MRDELIGLVEDEWFNILKLDRLAESLDHLRVRCGMERSVTMHEEKHHALLALHCVNFTSMSWSTRAGFPSALLAVLGLDAGSGPVLLGETGWRTVEERFTAMAQAEPATVNPATKPAHGQGISAPRWRAPVGQSLLAAPRKFARWTTGVSTHLRFRFGTWILGDLVFDLLKIPRSAPCQPPVTTMTGEDGDSVVRPPVATPTATPSRTGEMHGFPPVLARILRTGSTDGHKMQRMRSEDDDGEDATC